MMIQSGKPTTREASEALKLFLNDSVNEMPNSVITSMMKLNSVATPMKATTNPINDKT